MTSPFLTECVTVGDAIFLSVSSPDAYEAACFKEVGFSALALVNKKAKVAMLKGPSIAVSFHTDEGLQMLRELLALAQVCWIADGGSEIWCKATKAFFFSCIAKTNLVFIFCGTAASPWMADVEFRHLIDQGNLTCYASGTHLLTMSQPLLTSVPSRLADATKLVAKRVGEYVLQHQIATLNSSSKVDQASVDKQVRGGNRPLLIPPYREVRHLPKALVLQHLCHDNLRVDLSSILQEPSVHIGRLLGHMSELNRDGDEESLNQDVPVGEFWTPWEYINQTKLIPSPFLANVMVDMESANNIVRLLEMGPVLAKREIFSELARWGKLRDELGLKEDELHSSMYSEVASVLKGKKLLLFEKLAAEAGIVDDELMTNLREGFPLTGKIGATGRWRRELKPASMGEQEHRLAAKWIRAEVLGKCIGGFDKEALVELDKVTGEEVEQGFLTGPYTLETALDRAGPGLTFARRFGLRQKDKLRPIDDYSVSRTNACLTTVEKAKIDSLDEYLALARFMIEAASAAHLGNPITMPDMSVRPVKLHEDWMKEGALHLQGRCLDLANAYKQFAVSPKSLEHSALAVPNLDGATDIYFSKVLPFGATASVYHFLRIAEVVKLILKRRLGLLLCCYFDDFPCVTYAALASVSQFAAEKALDLLGISFSTKNHKRHPFRNCFALLGVKVTYPDDYLATSAIKVENTQERQIEIRDSINLVLAKGSLSQAEAASLAGRIGFLSSQAWSRAGSLLAAPVRNRADSGSSNNNISDELRDSLQAAMILVSAPPRHIRVNHAHHVRWIFTDAAVEPTDEQSMCVTVGGVLLDQDASPLCYFSEVVPEVVTRLWEDKTQPVTYAESLGTLLAKRVWKSELTEYDVIFGIDNIAAQHSLIRGTSRSAHLRALLRCHLLEDRAGSYKAWYTWVPSESNIADAPSRLEVRELECSGAARTAVPVSVWNEIREDSLESCANIAERLVRQEA